MFRRSPRSVVLWAVAAATAVATAVSVAGSLSSLRRQERAFGRLRTVVVATHDLARGTTVGTSDLTVRHVRGQAPADRAFDDASAAEGRVVTVPVLRGSPVTDRHLAPRDRRGAGAVVPPGHRALRFVTEDGVEPRPGDTVDVYAAFDPAGSVVAADAADATGAAWAGPTGAGPGASAVTVASGVTVLSAEPVDGERTGITVLVREEDARHLAYAAVAGTLAVALAPPEAAAAATGAATGAPTG